MNHDIETPIEPVTEAPEDARMPETEPGPRDSEATMQAATARITELENELGEMRDKWMRSEADMQNLRARTKRDVEDARQYAVQKFARDVVESAENMKRGISSLPAHEEGEDGLVTKLREGFHSIERSFVGVLERHGVVGHDPEGAAFDANLHQAMAEAPSETHATGTVIQAWTPAWTLNGRLLKPAMVVVSKGAPEADGTSAQEPRAEA